MQLLSAEQQATKTVMKMPQIEPSSLVFPHLKNQISLLRFKTKLSTGCNNFIWTCNWQKQLLISYSICRHVSTFLMTVTDHWILLLCNKKVVSLSNKL